MIPYRAENARCVADMASLGRLAALDQHSGGSKPYQRKIGSAAAGTIPGGNVGPAPALGPALGRRVVAVDAEANRFYGQVSILRLINAVFIWQALGIWR